MSPTAHRILRELVPRDIEINPGVVQRELGVTYMEAVKAINELNARASR